LEKEKENENQILFVHNLELIISGGRYQKIQENRCQSFTIGGMNEASFMLPKVNVKPFELFYIGCHLFFWVLSSHNY